MPSERIQRRIDRLLDDVGAAGNASGKSHVVEETHAGPVISKGREVTLNGPSGTHRVYAVGWEQEPP